MIENKPGAGENGEGGGGSVSFGWPTFHGSRCFDVLWDHVDNLPPPSNFTHLFLCHQTSETYDLMEPIDLSWSALSEYGVQKY